MNGDKPTSILVVDDDEDITAFIYGQLEPQGFVLDSAGTGELGLKLALENEYDIIILDLMLPGMNGLEVCRALRERSERYTPVLMLTARGAVENKIEGFAAGADDYLAKPFSILELDARVKALVRRSAAPASKRLQIADLTLDLFRLLSESEIHYCAPPRSEAAWPLPSWSKQSSATVWSSSLAPPAIDESDRARR